MGYVDLYRAALEDASLNNPNGNVYTRLNWKYGKINIPSPNKKTNKRQRE